MLKYRTYKEHEGGEWVVLVHGAGGSSAIWFKQIRAFRSVLNVLLVDLRGHGRSRDFRGRDGVYSLQSISLDIVDVLDHLGIESAHFVGVSLGTILIRCIEDLRPERVKSLVMAGAITGFNAWARFLISLGHALKHIVPFPSLYAVFAWIIMPGRHAREAREVFRNEAKKVTPAEFRRWFGLTKQVVTDLKRLSDAQPNRRTLYVMGKHDYIFLERARIVTDRFSNASLEVIAESGHVCNVECPDEFNRVALAFIAGTL